ncbi:hypothetical protein INT47_012045 [Mucor saturninus]|uniref:Uncharacterized protein n=1 Tax=Mucor saturninus TaxID=64648 RepID=A0A8H7UR56_9FUNG|nr:hypothetical protein INT47_012045 [Mucor saturninus]
MDSPTTSQQGLNLFVRDSYVRSSWIAFFSLWVLWGLSYFLRHAVNPDKDNYPLHQQQQQQNHPGDTEAVVGGTNVAGNRKLRKHDTMTDRLRRSHDVLFENTLMLLSVLTLNTFGDGATRSVMVLSWIFFAFSLIHALTQGAYGHYLIRLGFNLIFFGVALAIGGLAFSRGWW